MFKQDNYEEIFSHRITNQNIQLIKKFFIFQLPNQPTIKPYSSLMNKIKEPSTTVNKKNNPKFTGGFQQAAKSTSNNQEEQALGSSSIVLKSKKAPTTQISSFLLGLTGRIEKQSKSKLAQLEANQKITCISPDKRINYEQVITNLNKLRKQNRTKYASMMPTSNTSNSQSLSNQNQLPLLQKRLSSPDKRSTSNVVTAFTPLINNKSSTPTCCSQQQKQREKRLQKINLQSNRAISITYSSKMLKPLQQPAFMKGYLAYDPDVKQYLDKYQSNILEEPLHKKPFTSLTATNYLILHRQNLRVIAEKNSDEQIQIASLTKIMTCYLSILICRKFKIDPKDTLVRVTEKAEMMPGTSAQLQAGDIIKIYDLFYGLMLPSGNDASVAIAEAMGKLIQKNKKKPSRKTYFETFIHHMNLLAKQIGVQQTYQNTSGLPFNPNFSSPKAVSLLTSLAMKNPLFYQIINCKQYQIQIRNERYGLARKLMWKNTNKLLWKGWEGVKTGTTETAGHCLMSCKGDYLISVFDCETLNKRFTQCVRIYEIILNLPLTGLNSPPQKKQNSNTLTQMK